MNSKSEWNHPRIPRIVIEAGENQVEDLESGLGRKGEGEKRDRRRGAQVYTPVRNPKRRGTGEGMSIGRGDELKTTFLI